MTKLTDIVVRYEYYNGKEALWSLLDAVGTEEVLRVLHEWEKERERNLNLRPTTEELAEYVSKLILMR